MRDHRILPGCNLGLSLPPNPKLQTLNPKPQIRPLQKRGAAVFAQHAHGSLASCVKRETLAAMAQRGLGFRIQSLGFTV